MGVCGLSNCCCISCQH